MTTLVVYDRGIGGFKGTQDETVPGKRSSVFQVNAARLSSADLKGSAARGRSEGRQTRMAPWTSQDLCCFLCPFTSAAYQGCYSMGPTEDGQGQVSRGGVTCPQGGGKSDISVSLVFQAPGFLRHTIDRRDNNGSLLLIVVYAVPVSPGQCRLLNRQASAGRQPFCSQGLAQLDVTGHGQPQGRMAKRKEGWQGRAVGG